MWLSAFCEIWETQSGVAEDSNFLRCHAVLNSSILHVTLYRDIPVFWGVTLYHDIPIFWGVTLNRDIQGCWESRGSLYSSVLGCHIESWYSRVLGVTLCPLFKCSGVSHWIVIFKGAGSHAVPFIQVFWGVTLNRDIQGCWVPEVTLYPYILVFWGVTLYREIQVSLGVTLNRDIQGFW